MQTLARGFLHGLLVVVPAAGTLYVLYAAVRWIDDLVGAPVPGLGVALVVVGVTAVGLLARNVLGRTLVRWAERLLASVPVVKLLYGALRDLMGAFVGERRGFERPVWVDLGGGARALGFVTCRRFDDPALDGWVGVYLPQAYNFAGHLVLLPAERVRPLDAEGGQLLAFVMSGGLLEMSAARTVAETSLSALRLPPRRS
ncbi:MAG: DUF502 domain-containing protein [Myxococcales bacterium]|nr:DUF502 domain-containing protein [Myxococcales bacterium]